MDINLESAVSPHTLLESGNTSPSRDKSKTPPASDSLANGATAQLKYAMNQKATVEPPARGVSAATQKAALVKKQTRKSTPKTSAAPVVGFSHAALVKIISQKVLRRDPEWELFGRNNSENSTDRLKDFIFASAGHLPTPEEAFDELRWGGLFIYISTKMLETVDVARKFTQLGAFILEKHPTFVRRGLFGLPWSPFSEKIHYFVARKVYLIKPGQSTDRFTYNVQLTKRKEFGDEYVVQKQVPSFDRVISRLREKFPDVDTDTLRRRAKKFTDKIFPVFLTRELAMLKLLQRDLPPEFAARVPTVVHADYRDYDGTSMVQTLYLKWLRNGRKKPLTQLEFASQSAELLSAIHDRAGIIHLDLRLDNFVITEDGVGFVDFGSAVRVGEHFSEASLLSTLFEEMMRTSQIQKMLGTMSTKGLVTSQSITSSHHKVDKAIDFFYLAVQMNSPQSNPDFADLVLYDKASQEASLLKHLTDDILRPPDPTKPKYTSASDILAGVKHIEQQLKGTAAESPAPKGAAA